MEDEAFSFTLALCEQKRDREGGRVSRASGQSRDYGR